MRGVIGIVPGPVLSRVQLFAIHQAPLSMEFSRKEYRSGLPFSISGDLLDPGIEPTSSVSPELEDGFFTAEPPRKPNLSVRLVG